MVADQLERQWLLEGTVVLVVFAILVKNIKREAEIKIHAFLASCGQTMLLS